MAVIESDLSDIQFLGNWNSQQPSSPSSFVSAIVLTPENSPSEISRTFSRSQTSVVHVGRTPAVDPVGPVDDRATFSNPVMSRNHAKVTFADSGSVFVIDTNSHHGTWVTRSTAEFKLAGESPFQLHDGDRLTFGKEVQRNGILHTPLTVTVKLLHSASTPSSMSISSTSVSPASKVASPRPRNRFSLDSSSDSDLSSDNEDSREEDPRTGPNAIRVELPFHRSHCILGSPKSPKSTEVIPSESGSSICKNHVFATSQSPPLQIHTSALDLPRFSSELLPPPGLELEGMGVLTDVNHEENSITNAHQSSSPSPPWRRLSESSWPNLSIFDRMPDLLQEPPRRIGRLLNPLWMRASMVTGGDERGGRPSLLSRIQTSGDAMDTMDENPDQLHHGSHLHGHGYGRRGVRLDANWGLFGQSNAAMKEVKTLSERLDELNEDLEALKTKGDDVERVDLVFSRLDELSSQLKDKIIEDAKVSQKLFAETTELEALKTSLAALQNDMSILKAHKSAMQTDIRFLRADHEELKNSVKDSFHEYTNDTATLTGDILRTREDAVVLRGEFEALRNQTANNMHDLIPLKTNMSEVTNGMEILQTNMRSTNISMADMQGEIHALGHTSSERDLRLREQVRTEVRTLIEQGGELSSITGKRKRGDDDSIDTPITGDTPIPSVSRPRKRMRIVLDCAVAGALGALGAWLGLAFL